MTDFVTFGDVSNPSGSLAMTIAANAVTNAKAAQMPAATFKGNNTGAPANAVDLTAAQAKAALAIANTDVSGLGTLATQNGVLASLPTASAIMLRDANANSQINNIRQGFTSTVTAGATTTLTVASTYLQFFTGTLAQTVVLPDVTTLVLGQQFYIRNNSTGLVTVNSSGLNLIRIIGPGTRVIVTCTQLTGSTAASWSAMYLGINITDGKVLAVSNSLTLSGTDGNSLAINSASASVSGTNTGDQTSFPASQITGTILGSSEPAYTGDVTSAAGSTVNVLPTVNGNVGSFGLAAQVAQLVVNAKGQVTAAANVAISIVSTAVSDFVAAVQTVALIATDNAQFATTYTLASGDQYKEISLTNATGCAVSIPLNAVYAFPIGTRIAVWADAAGTYTIVGVSGVTLNGVSAGTRTGTMTVNLSGVRNGVVLRKTATDIWTVSGAIGAVA